MGSIRALLALCVIALAFTAVVAQEDAGADMSVAPASSSLSDVLTELPTDPWANDPEASEVATDEPTLVAELAAARPPVVATTVVRSTATTPCGARGGTCKAQSAGCAGTFQPGLCPGQGASQCCVVRSVPSAPATVPTASCGPYASASPLSIKGNGDKMLNVVKIAKEHLTDPSKHAQLPTESDNTLTVTTACALHTMLVAAKSAGHNITVNAGFRTKARQQYFWDCWKTKKCNNGAMAAQPGTSIYGLGLAVNLKFTTAGYEWLSANAHKYGFVRTVPQEKWLWEHRAGWKRAPFT